MRQILVNLVENGIKYSPDGGTIERRRGDGRVDGAVPRAGRGHGHPGGRAAADLPEVLPPRSRHDLRIGGTGLGLYIRSELVERMGGRIWVESREGKGSAFYFELPSAGVRPAKT